MKAMKLHCIHGVVIRKIRRNINSGKATWLERKINFHWWRKEHRYIPEGNLENGKEDDT